MSQGTATLRPLEYTLLWGDLPSPAQLYLPVPILADTVRVHAKGTGTVTGSELAVFAAVGRT